MPVVDIDPLTNEPVDGVYANVPTFVTDGLGGIVQSGAVTVTVLNNEVTFVEFNAASTFNDDNSLGQGHASFVYTVSDDGSTTLASGFPAVPQPAPESVDATVTIHVRPQNDPPTVTNDTIDSTTFAGQPLLEFDAGQQPFTFPASFLTGNDFAGQLTTQRIGLPDGSSELYDVRFGHPIR